MSIIWELIADLGKKLRSAITNIPVPPKNRKKPAEELKYEVLTTKVFSYAGKKIRLHVSVSVADA